jgi:hypothetical protein
MGFQIAVPETTVVATTTSELVTATKAKPDQLTAWKLVHGPHHLGDSEPYPGDLPALHACHRSYQLLLLGYPSDLNQEQHRLSPHAACELYWHDSLTTCA